MAVGGKRDASHFVGVLGWPLEVTLSPLMHNVGFRRLGLDWIYLRWPVAPDDLDHAVRGLRALGADGANVTMPHKESIVEHLDSLDEDAGAIGAVNTVRRSGKELIGHNTDVVGFSEFLVEDAGFQPDGTSALVLGAGGAARAVVKALGNLGAGDVTIAARNREAGASVAALADDATRSARAIGWEDASDLIDGVDLVVNATPIGMRGEALLSRGTFRPNQCVIDLIYSPPTTPLIERARASGANGWGGLGMLVRQAAASFAIWTGQQAPLDAMSAAAIRGIGHHH
ncbi:MAG: shikimate dehydrogenase [Actinobacteria bacterium]|nr:shikimate dehydrogenase [Actinomycetota bacterium]